jgi:hypothetical protein
MKCSKTTPINIYGPELYNGCFGYKTMFATSVPRNSAFKRETHVLHLFTFCMFQNAPKTLPNISLGQMQMNGCFGYETLFGTSVPRNSAFRSETQVLHLFAFGRFSKCSDNTPKQHFKSNVDEWMLCLQNHFRNFGTPK